MTPLFLLPLFVLGEEQAYGQAYGQANVDPTRWNDDGLQASFDESEVQNDDVYVLPYSGTGSGSPEPGLAFSDDIGRRRSDYRIDRHNHKSEKFCNGNDDDLMAWEDLDFYGYDLRNIRDVPDWWTCADHCNADHSCMAWTWGKPGAWWGVGNTCYLKHADFNFQIGQDRTVYNTNVFSGMPCVPRFKYTKRAWAASSPYGFLDGYCRTRYLPDLFKEDREDVRIYPVGTKVFSWAIPNNVDKPGRCSSSVCTKANEFYYQGKKGYMYMWKDVRTLTNQDCRKKFNAEL